MEKGGEGTARLSSRRCIDSVVQFETYLVVTLCGSYGIYFILHLNEETPLSTILLVHPLRTLGIMGVDAEGGGVKGP